MYYYLFCGLAFFFNIVFDRLRGKNADQLSVSGADPVVARKIQLKLTSLVQKGVPEKYQALIDGNTLDEILAVDVILYFYSVYN